MNARLLPNAPTARLTSLSLPSSSSSSSSSASSSLSSRHFHRNGFLSRDSRARRRQQHQQRNYRLNNKRVSYASENYVKNVASVETRVPLKICWQLWQDRTRIPNWMPWIAKVEYDDIDKTKTKWILETEQFGQKLQFSWTAKDLEPVEYERIAWKSEDGLRNRGSVTFKDVGNNSTKIEMMIEYEVPAVLKPVGELVSPLVGSIIGKDLERFDEFARKVEKQLLKK
ncbi:unnamed protein product [Bathycoccus prasinos]|mmetsp:Transcript_3355/g.11982  ORF Transcript_3355/g.11982 Transcript_3355/m.11982 type:complete len:227 (-) Transcript_3355:2049-2729(-)